MVQRNRTRSPDTQSRWFDNVVISTKPIGPIVSEPEPTLMKTPYQGPAEQAAWEVELAAHDEGDIVVWRSRTQATGDRVKVHSNTGDFLGPLEDSNRLAYGKTYFSRVRQQSSEGDWSDWSGWHQPFVTPDE